MEISPGITPIHETLWIAKHKALILSDLHLGYEDSLHTKGILVPKSQIKVILHKLQQILEMVHPTQIIINGDLKHEFGKVTSSERTQITALLELFREQRVVFITGNHDQVLSRIRSVAEYQLGDTLIIHGDKLTQTTCSRIIIGHEHPAISLREKSKVEKFKCFLKGTWKGKELIALPSFNPLLEGTNVLTGHFLSPFLSDISNFEVFIVGEQAVLPFGKIRRLQKLTL